ncbi:La-related protein 6C [Bienertia sinuspersici]
MAQEEKIIKSSVGSSSISNNDYNLKSEGGGSGSGSGGGFKFNVHAAEFVPRSYTTSSSNQMSLSTGYFYPCVQFLQDAHGDHQHHHLDLQIGNPLSPDWFYLNHPPTTPPLSPTAPLNNNSSSSNNNTINNTNTDIDLQQKIIKQVEYLFSDLSLMANDTMAKHVNKDPEGYVPIPVIASMKKIKALVTDYHSLVQSLRSSTKLMVSKDNKKVKRRSPFTENYRDELQLHALVEYENAEIAERAPKSVLKNRKSDFDLVTDDDECSYGESPKQLQLLHQMLLNLKVSGGVGGGGGSAGRGRIKTKGLRNDRGLGLLSSPTHTYSYTAHPIGGGGGSPLHIQMQCDSKQRGVGIGVGVGVGVGPRMPDGTRGFTMGRGKPLISKSAPTTPSSLHS